MLIYSIKLLNDTMRWNYTLYKGKVLVIQGLSYTAYSSKIHFGLELFCLSVQVKQVCIPIFA